MRSSLIASPTYMKLCIYLLYVMLSFAQLNEETTMHQPACAKLPLSPSRHWCASLSGLLAVPSHAGLHAGGQMRTSLLSGPLHATSKETGTWPNFKNSSDLQIRLLKHANKSNGILSLSYRSFQPKQTVFWVQTGAHFKTSDLLHNI